VYVLFTVYSCAKVVAPGGGAVDSEPPQMTVISAEENATGLKDGEIVFRLDEFFTLKSPSANMFLNPLVDEELKYKIKGKTLIVKLPESLRENQTYTLTMNNLIADFHEGNILSNYEFVFSTGNVLDSLGLRGSVTEAATGETLEKVSVYLFPAGADSVFSKRQFAYITQTSAGGVFEFRHLPAGEFRLFALREKNIDHLYNSPEEVAGFSEIPVFIKLTALNDTVFSSLSKLEKPLTIFSEKDSTLKILKTVKVKKGYYHIIFNNPVSNISVTPVEAGIADTVFVTQPEPGDTLSLWVINNKKDAAAFVISSAGQVLDTITIALKSAARGSGRSDDIPEFKLKVNEMFNNNRVHYFNPIIIRSTTPVHEIQPDSIFLISGDDTINATLQFSADMPLEIRIMNEILPGKEYTIKFGKGTLKDFYGSENDTLQFQFHVTDTSYYGKVRITLNNIATGCHLIEIAGQFKTYRYEFDTVPQNNSYVFAGIIPGEYSVRVIADNNCNGKWDTGNFKTLRQPEQIIRLQGKILVRSNWETEAIWSPE
jgi:hypothetical protein